MITTILLVVALICFFLGAIPLPNPGWARVNYIALGLFFWVLSVLIGGAHLVVR